VRARATKKDVLIPFHLKAFFGSKMFFITLVKWKTPPAKELVGQGTKEIKELEKQGIKVRVF